MDSLEYCRNRPLIGICLKIIEFLYLYQFITRSQRARWEHTDIQVDKDMFELNVFSVINLSRIVLKNMLEKKSGHIAVMSSVAGKLGAPLSGSYSGIIKR